MGTLSDLFAAQLADLKVRSDESDRKIQQHLSELHQTLAEWEQAEKAFEKALADM